MALDAYPYCSLIGSVSFVARGTRPDISSLTNIFQMRAADYGPNHIGALEDLVMYLRDTRNVDLVMTPRVGERLWAASDAALLVDKGRGRSGYCVLFEGMLVDWCSCRQSLTSLSSMEAEVYEAGRSVLWVSFPITHSAGSHLGGQQGRPGLGDDGCGH